MPNPQMFVEVVTTGAQAAVTVVGHGDDVGDAFGDDEDFVIVLNSAANSANAAITDVLVGTPVTPALTANSAILSNTTTDGDILFAVSDNGHSKGLLKLDGSEGTVLLDGNVGIGMAPSLATLEVSGYKIHLTNNDWAGFFLTDTSGSDSEKSMVMYNQGGDLKFGRAEESSLASLDPFIVLTNEGETEFAGDVTIAGTTPTLTIGDAGAEDAAIIFDGNEQDFYIGLEDAANTLVIGKGSTLGTTVAMEIDSNLNIGIGAAPTSAYRINLSATFTAAGGSNAYQMGLLGTLTAAVDSNAGGMLIAPTLVEAGSGTHPRMVSLDVRAPTITGAGAATTSTALIHLRTDASGGSNNYQIWDSLNSAFLSTSGVWTDSSHGDVKIHSPADLDIMPQLLAQLSLKQYHRRSPLYDSDGKTMENADGSTVWTDTVRSDDSYLRYGPLAEEVPEFLATADRKGIGAGYTAGFLIGVAQNHDARIEALEKALGV